MISTKLAIIGLILVFAVNIYPGFFNHWYDNPMFDTTLHFLGGFLTAMLLFSFYQKNFKINSPFFQFITLVGLVTIVGVIWEFSEYLGNQLLSERVKNAFDIRVYFIGDLNDTIKDLLMDILGAMTYLGTEFLIIRRLHPFRRGYTQKRKSDF